MSCGQCGGFFYCTRAHQVAHWARLGHQSECGRILLQVARAEEMRDGDGMRWLTWARRATLDVDEGREQPCSLLQHLGVHGVGPYRRECKCYAKTPFGTLSVAGADEEDDGHLHLGAHSRRSLNGDAKAEPEATIAWDKDDDPHQEQGSALHQAAARFTDDDGDAGANGGAVNDVSVSTWPQLYRRLGFPASSPAALVLSAAATIHHALRITGVAAASPADAPLVVHVLVGRGGVYVINVIHVWAGNGIGIKRNHTNCPFLLTPWTCPTHSTRTPHQYSTIVDSTPTVCTSMRMR